MTQAVAHILKEVEQLSESERVELTDRLVEDLAGNISPEIEKAQLAEVRNRVAEVEAGSVALISGEDALAHVRRIVAGARSVG